MILVFIQIIENNLFGKDSLRIHTHHMRLLTLRVMEFISEYQVGECPLLLRRICVWRDSGFFAIIVCDIYLLIEAM